MAKKKNNEGNGYMGDVDNIHLKGTFYKDRKAIAAANEVARELDCKPKNAARWILVNCREYAIKKAQKVKKLLAS